MLFRSPSLGVVFVSAVLVMSAACATGVAQSRHATLSYILPVAPPTIAFGYARISPNGRLLAYSTTIPDGQHPQLVHIVDLQSQTILFSEAGVDASWSPNGQHVVFLSLTPGDGVSIWHLGDHSITRNVAPDDVGDYFSWGNDDGRDVILTVQGNYFGLNDIGPDPPTLSVRPCDGKPPLRPLLSKNGRRITAFVDDGIVVRNLTDCRNIVRTNVQGAKADFSYDGRYIAFHAQKPDAVGYEIQVLDTVQPRLWRIADLPGSALFPSWTADGRLCFKYDSPDFHGFVLASNVMSGAFTIPPRATEQPNTPVKWNDVFPESAPPRTHTAVVMVWSSWSAHAGVALNEFNQTSLRSEDDVYFATSVAPGSDEAIVAVMLKETPGLPRIPLAAERLHLTGGQNQIPATLKFQDGLLVEKRLGTLSRNELRQWLHAKSTI